MTRLLQPLFALFAAATDDKLRQMVEYLKEENRILRSRLPTRITLTERERTRLIKFGSTVGGAIRTLVTVVSYRTFCRWTAAVAGPPLKKKRAASARKPGRPRTPEDVRKLVVEITEENGWGYLCFRQPPSSGLFSFFFFVERSRFGRGTYFGAWIARTN